MIISSSAPALAQVAAFEPFDTFIGRVKTVPIKTLSTSLDSAITTLPEIEQMRAAIVERYRRVSVVRHSFTIDEDYYDCVQQLEQPAIAKYHILTIADPPPFGHTGSGATAALSDGTIDPFGNSRVCDPNEVPMKRLTIQAMMRLGAFYMHDRQSVEKRLLDGVAQEAVSEIQAESVDKSMSSESLQSLPSINPPHLNDPSASETQNEKEVGMFAAKSNMGGTAVLNVWSPSVKASSGQTLSVMEEIFEAGTGKTTQLIEAGYAIEPDLYGDVKPHLFIFETQDDFVHSSLDDIDNDFVLVAEDALLGESLSPSVKGGEQKEIQIEFQLFQNNWWLLVNGKSIGYYPAALFSGHSLAQKADVMILDVAGYGSTSMPQIGSGTLPNGFTPNEAAYIRGALLFPSPARINPAAPILMPLSQQLPEHFRPNAPCANTSGPFTKPFSSAAPELFFYLGGPGGQLSACAQ
jgi:hypothetical protein